MDQAGGYCRQEDETKTPPGLHSVHEDFPHKPPGRLNHGSFGAAPTCVLEAQHSYQQCWNQRPDDMFFRGELFNQLRHASAACIPLLTRNAHRILPSQVALIENACAATTMIAHRWSRLVSPGDLILVLDCIYGACRMCLQEYCCTDSRIGGELLTLSIYEEHGSFPKSSAEIVARFRRSLEKQIISACGKGTGQEGRSSGMLPPFGTPRKLFFFLDQVSSQPAFVLPLVQMLKEVGVCLDARSQDVPGTLTVGEICIDAAHAFALQDLDVLQQFESLPDQLRPHWWFANLHKWAFAPPTATVVFAKDARLTSETSHPMVSWFYGKGLPEECLWAGTRDYSALLSVPTALRYLQTWRSSESDRLSPPAFSKAKALEAGRYLSELWGTSDTLPDPELVCALIMVELPRELDMGAADTPGLPTGDTKERRSVRSILRDDFGVEAAVGNFGPCGNFIRLSYAVYNTWDDILKLGRGVLDILQAQRALISA